MPTPEELARRNIDKQFAACGWVVQDRGHINLYASRGVAGCGKTTIGKALAAKLEWDF